jgi:hypothetical protein
MNDNELLVSKNPLFLSFLFNAPNNCIIYTYMRVCAHARARVCVYVYGYVVCTHTNVRAYLHIWVCCVYRSG